MTASAPTLRGSKPEVWFRNPRNYIRELVEVGASKIVWDSGALHKSGVIDPYKFSDLYFGATVPWESIIMHLKTAVHIGRGRNQNNPIGVYPVWNWGEPLENLEKLIEVPWSENFKPDPALAPSWLPVRGQEHMIFIQEIPPVNTAAGKQIINILDELQEEHPEVTLHLHALYSFKVMFGRNFKSVDCDPRTIASKGKVFMPNGRECVFEHTLSEPHWVHLLGMMPVELRVPRNRCIFNIKACLWAAEHFKEAVKFETRNKDRSVSPTAIGNPMPTSQSIMVTRIRSADSDKILCNTCTLQLACKYFREGAVCIVPGSEPVELARFFHTRDSDKIIDGLGTLLATQTHRLEKALETEEAEGKLHPEVTKIINTLFDRGRKLAMLVDPRLNGGPKIAVNFGDTNTQINAGTPQALMAAIMDQFARRGISRDMVTPEMLMQVFNTPEDLREKAVQIAIAAKTAGS